jgi:hypothetical protein
MTAFETMLIQMFESRKRLSYAAVTLLIVGVSFFVGYKVGGNSEPQARLRITRIRIGLVSL